MNRTSSYAKAPQYVHPGQYLLEGAILNVNAGSGKFGSNGGSGHIEVNGVRKTEDSSYSNIRPDLRKASQYIPPELGSLRVSTLNINDGNGVFGSNNGSGTIDFNYTDSIKRVDDTRPNRSSQNSLVINRNVGSGDFGTNDGVGTVRFNLRPKPGPPTVNPNSRSARR